MCVLSLLWKGYNFRMQSNVCQYSILASQVSAGSLGPYIITVLNVIIFSMLRRFTLATCQRPVEYVKRLYFLGWVSYMWQALWIRPAVPKENICWACKWLFLELADMMVVETAKNVFSNSQKTIKMIIMTLKPVSKCPWSPWNGGMAMQSFVGLSPKSGKWNAGEGCLGAPEICTDTHWQVAFSALGFLFCF